MQNNAVDKRIEKLKEDKQKFIDKAKEYNQKVTETQKKIDELENEKIILACRNTGFSLEDVISHISALKPEKTSKSENNIEKELETLEKERTKDNDN